MAYIQEYEPKFHKDVNRIFGDGILEHWPFALQLGLKNPVFLTILLTLSSIGYYLHSIIVALIVMGIIIGGYTYFVYGAYESYVM